MLRWSSQQTDDPFSENYNQSSIGHAQDIIHRYPQSVRSLQHLSSTKSPSHDNLRPDRKSYSLADIRARYEASPLRGRTGRRSSNDDRRSSLEREIFSPQPIAPLKLPFAVEDVYEDDAEYWDTTHPAALSPIREAQQPDPVTVPSRSIAQGLSELSRHDTEPGYTVPSTAWDSESLVLECPTPVRSSSDDDPVLETRQWSTVVNGTSEADFGSTLVRTRPRRKVPENTMESAAVRQKWNVERGSPQMGVPSYHSQNPNFEPLRNAKRALTMQTTKRTMGAAALRAKLRSMSFDQIAKRRQHDSAETGGPGQSNVESRWDSPTAIEADEGQETSLSNAQSARSRKSSSVSASGSVFVPGALRRAWRKWSGWRLNLGDRSSQITDPQGAGASPQQGSTDFSEAQLEAAADPHTKVECASPVETPPPKSPKRPIFPTSASSHGSLNPTAARPTTALSPPEVTEWTPSFIRPSSRSSFALRPSVSPGKQGSLNLPRPSLHHVRSAASFIASRSVARSSPRIVHGDHGQAPSSAIMSTFAEHHDESTGSTSTGTAYHSIYPTHRISHQSLRSPRRERDEDRKQAEIPLNSMGSAGRGRDRNREGKEGRDQRIKKVKVVVSLDGAGDLVVDASVLRPGDGQRGGKVRSFVKRWEAAAASSGDM